MDLLRELFRYHEWANLQLIDYCIGQPRELMDEKVAGTDRSILHTLTHVIGTEQWYLELLKVEPGPDPIRQGEIRELSDLRQRCELHLQQWEGVLDRIAEMDVTLSAQVFGRDIAGAQNVLVVQAIQHGIDHRTQICTTLTVLGLKPPIIDGWRYWAQVADHK